MFNDHLQFKVEFLKYVAIIINVELKQLGSKDRALVAFKGLDTTEIEPHIFNCTVTNNFTDFRMVNDDKGWFVHFCYDLLTDRCEVGKVAVGRCFDHTDCVDCGKNGIDIMDPSSVSMIVRKVMVFYG